MSDEDLNSIIKSIEDVKNDPLAVVRRSSLKGLMERLGVNNEELRKI